jgi:hypothetical protein
MQPDITLPIHRYTARPLPILVNDLGIGDAFVGWLMVDG